MNKTFSYQEAFIRNIGLITEEEQENFKNYIIAIPGMGGVGGAYLISLVRQGFEKFKIADLDEFELKNFNRQYGARLDTIGREKVVVMKEEALKINPNCTIEIYNEGVSENNIDTFLDQVDLVIDSIDIFEIDARRLLVNKALNKKIPVISAAPVGFGTAFLIFMPNGPTFDQFFSINDNMSYQKKLISFLIGYIPKLLQLPYMKSTNLEEKRGPSSIGAINLCAGVIVINAIKVLSKRGDVKAVPYYHQFDVMRNKYVVRKLWFGNNNPIQKLKILLAPYLVKD